MKKRNTYNSKENFLEGQGIELSGDEFNRSDISFFISNIVTALVWFC
jgi:hypothetical protein